ncbi:ferritin-like domain-containing protein [Herbaspirillum sp. LeCh32-8]|uniref:ferritin-like domain-containing protein n=1 Tax=Herbaspirillum sp. LeCh32-8 TaxID=2821356 RepID=UPI001AE969BD|nr:ferritin-like domain-containing protein [Herbaspirillum sp. LeCh32-8]MBP0600105.1 ferritin-like domain-containing protein [Herbaspirillum sp. LeCh32-8]
MDHVPSPVEEFSFAGLRAGALACLKETAPPAKCAMVKALHRAWHAGELALEEADIAAGVPAAGIPGRPARPELVSPLQVKLRSMATPEGRAALIHALAHIEFNAINLALDAVWRFPGMPRDFYADWLQVAAEEAYHFSLLADHLQHLGYAYGDFTAHNSLWEMAEKTGADVLGRIALVPRTLEARGLDAAPPVRAKLAQAGDIAAAEILDIIMRDEVGHVLIGNRWFNWLCEQRGLDPISTFAELCVRYKAPPLRGPFNLEARRAAGFSDEELLMFKDVAG